MPTERRKVDVAGSWIAARLVWIKDAASVSAETTWRLRPGFSHQCASVVAGVAGAHIRAAMVCVPDKAAGPSLRRGHAAGGLVDRRRIACGVQPAVEVIPAQRPYHAVAVRVVALDPQMEFPKERALVTALLEKLR